MRTIAHSQLDDDLFLVLRIAIVFIKGVFRRVVQGLVFGVDVVIVFYEASDLRFVEGDSRVLDIMSTGRADFLLDVAGHVFLLSFYS